MGLVIAVKDGADSDQVFLDTATTSSTAAAESRQVGLATAVKAADEAGNGRGVDTVATQDAAGETCTPIYPQTTYKTKMEEYKDEKVHDLEGTNAGISSFFRDWTSRLRTFYSVSTIEIRF